MARINLTDRQRQQLQHLTRRGRDARVVRRAQGLLWLDQGEHPMAVAQRLGVTRESVYAWVRRLQHQGGQSLAEKLMEQPRSGRPREKRHAVQELVQQVMDTQPSQYGYQAQGWTAALLRRHLATTEGIEVSDATVRRCLKGMGYRWKQPRYVLARRDPFWRQAKGG
ncbi:MAG TPA: winged helix-turn-helix domain-containing protein [Dehalococcoidia bacterium]|nr:winged helix-turn-helix domain-containing protein [Dehalococcoidia bacterium]